MAKDLGQKRNSWTGFIQPNSDRLSSQQSPPPCIHYSLHTCIPVSLQRISPRYRRSDTGRSRKICTDGFCGEEAEYQLTRRSHPCRLSRFHVLPSERDEHVLQRGLLRKQRETLMKVTNHNVQNTPEGMRLMFQCQCIKASCHPHSALRLFVLYILGSLVIFSNKVASFRKIREFLHSNKS